MHAEFQQNTYRKEMKLMAKKGLGKGLGVLLPATEPITTAPEISEDAVVELKLMDIEPNAGQPRKKFDDDHLTELSESIKEHGVITPILVHKSDNGYYRIIAGERRWRASKLAGKKTIPAIIKDYDKMKVYEVSLIENLQRKDLNPVEEALGYKKLMDDFGLTQEQIAQKLSKSRSGIANSLRLLSLSKEALELLENGSLSSGHAKILAGIDNSKLQTELAQLVAENGLSVRELEKLVKKPEAKKQPSKKEDINTMLAYEGLEKRIADIFSTKVKIVNNKGKGKITIDYYSNDDLERIAKLLENIGK